MKTEEHVAMCIHNHDPARLEYRPDGTRVCGACRDHYASRRRRYGKSVSNHRLEGVTTYDRTDRR